MPWVDTCAITTPEAVFPEWFVSHWQKLALDHTLADNFCSGPVWNLAYQQVINPGRKLFYAASGRGAVIFGKCLSADGEIVLAPLEDSWLYGQPLLGDDAAALLAQAMPEIIEECGPAPVFLLSGMIRCSARALSVYTLFSHLGHDFYFHSAMRQCSASLAGGVDGWLSRRSANCRAKLKKSARLAAAAGIRFERVLPGPEDADAIYERMLGVERKSWKGIGECGMTESPSREFYALMIRMLAASRAALVIFATLDGEDIGFIFGGLAGTCYRGQQFSYSREFSRFSPGNLMQREKIAWLCELGCTRYDMGPATGPRMEYKLRWTEHFQEFQTWIMQKRRA